MNSTQSLFSLILFLTISLISTSCAQNKISTSDDLPTSENISSTPTVDNNLTNPSEVGLENSTDPLDPSLTTQQTSDSKSTFDGKSEQETVTIVAPLIDNSKKNNLIFFGPSFNRVGAYIPVLKALEDNKISYGVVSGIEMGAIIAAMIASGQNSSMLEWSLLKFYQELTDPTPLTKDWLDAVNETLLTSINASRIEDTSKFLFLPILKKTKSTNLKNNSVNANELLYVTKGPLKYTLYKNLQKYQQSKQAKQTEFYSALDEAFLDPIKLNKFNIQKCIYIDALAPNTVNNSPNDIPLNMSKIILNGHEMSKKCQLTIKLPLQNWELNSDKMHNEYFKQCYNTVKILIPKIKSIFQ